MAKQRKQQHDEMSLSVGHIKITVNGETTARSLNYSRTRKPDGSIKERGLPPGMKPNPSVSDLMGYLFGKVK